jgi:hypothetical protein
VELFLDPAIRVPTLAVGWRLAKKALGFRMLMDVIPLDASLVKGSHGRATEWTDDGPVLMTKQGDLLESERMRSVEVYNIIWRHVFE